VKHVSVLFLSMVMVMCLAGCQEKSPMEEGLEYLKKGAFELAIKEFAKVEGEQKASAETLIAKAREELAKKSKEECRKLALDRFNLLKETKDLESFDHIVAKLKTMTCENLDVEPYVRTSYFHFISYLVYRAHPVDYVDAVAKYCEINHCEYKPPHMLVYEEEVKLAGSASTDVIQEQIPMVDHGRALEMFDWLVKQDMENIRYFDLYAQFLNKLEQFDLALSAYEAMNAMENAPFQFKDRARLMVDHLGKYVRKGRRPPREDENATFQYFWVEDAKNKSKIGGLKPKEEKKAE